MIFYFSGTGNSLYAARCVAQKQNIEMFDIAELMKTKRWVFVPQESEAVGFVFPVYAWGPPEIVLEFIKKLRLVDNNSYIFTLITCGEEVGNCAAIFRRALERSSLTLHASFSVMMPNNYNIVGSLDSKEQQMQILNNAVHALDSINELISAHSQIDQTTRGSLPGIKSKVVYPIFRRFADPAKKFRYTSPCVSCGLCVRVCPAENISLDAKGKPVWGDKCYFCLACLHRCPAQAIECGKSTVGKGRYYNPYCNNEDA